MSYVIAGVNFTCLADSISRYEVPEKECLLTLLAKLLGYCIILASTIVKLPQIILILKDNSIEGLSVPAFELELVGYTIALSYCLFKDLAFTAYGELAFLLLQALILVVLLYSYSPKKGVSTWIKVGIYSAVAPVLFSGSLSEKTFDTLYAGQTAVFVASRLPQIYKNFQAKSTGKLSSATSFMNFAGCIVRLFTSLQEKAPFNLVVSCLLGICTHGALFSQIVAYNFLGKREVKKEQAVKDELKKKK